MDIYRVSRRERSIHNKLSRSWCDSGGIPRDAKGELERVSSVDYLHTLPLGIQA